MATIKQNLQMAIRHLDLVIDQEGTVVKLSWMITVLSAILEYSVDDLNSALEAGGVPPCPTCKGTGRVVDLAEREATIAAIAGSGDCFGINYDTYLACPTCRPKEASDE